MIDRGQGRLPVVRLQRLVGEDLSQPNARLADIPTSMHNRILSVEIREVEMGMNELRLTFDNRDLRMFGEPGMGDVGEKDFYLRHEVVWMVQIGYEDTQKFTRQFAFRIKSIRGFRRLEVRGYESETVDMDQTSIHGRYLPQSFGGENSRPTITKALCAATIAKRNNLEIDPNHGVAKTLGEFLQIQQTGLTDAKMLTRLAKSVGFIWFIERIDNKRYFFFRPRGLFAVPVAAHVFEVGADDDVIEDLNVDNDIFRIPKTYLAAHIDPYSGVLKKYKAENLKTARDVMGQMTSLSENIKRGVTAGPPGGDPQIADVMFIPNMSNAIKAAGGTLKEDLDGFFKEIEKAFVKGRLVLRGLHSIQARHTIRLDGLGDFGGLWYVHTVTHRLQPGQVWKTSLALYKNAYDGIDAHAIANNAMAAVAGTRPGIDVDPPSDVGLSGRVSGRGKDAEFSKVATRGAGGQHPNPPNGYQGDIYNETDRVLAEIDRLVAEDKANQDLQAEAEDIVAARQEPLFTLFGVAFFWDRGDPADVQTTMDLLRAQGQPPPIGGGG